jgi:FkbM family methyltransferase
MQSRKEFGTFAGRENKPFEVPLRMVRVKIRFASEDSLCATPWSRYQMRDKLTSLHSSKNSFRRKLWPEKSYGVRFRLKRMWNFLFPSVPLLMHLPYGGWWLARNDVCSDAVFTGNFEEGERRFVERFLRAGMVVLDIGAHNGFYTMLAARKVGMSGQVIAFEPSPRERQRLLRHLRMNRLLANVVVCHLALDRSTGEDTLFVVEGRDTGCNSLRPPAVGESVKTMRVQKTSLDSFLREGVIFKVDFMKMDVEGAELNVLEGATELLGRRPRPVILAELADSRSPGWGHPASAVYDLLVERGYQWFSVDREGSLSPLHRTDKYGVTSVAFPVERLPEAKNLTADS